MLALLKNYFLKSAQLKDCTNEELLEYIKQYVPSKVPSAWFDSLVRLYCTCPDPSVQIKEIYETAAKLAEQGK